MTRSKGWFIAATIFTIINVLGAPFALFSGEWPHFMVHVVLSAVGAFAMWRFAGGARRTAAAGPAIAERQLSELQQSVDAIAVEVERIGESQRYAAKLAQERVAAEKPLPDNSQERK